MAALIFVLFIPWIFVINGTFKWWIALLINIVFLIIGHIWSTIEYNKEKELLERKQPKSYLRSGWK